MFKAALALVSLPLLALASPQPQYGAPAPAPAPAPSSSAAPAVPSAPPSTQGHVNVDVGFQNGFVFNPSNFTAPNGTIVTFFFPDNGTPHSVVQSSFADPCTPLQASGGNATGFDSGITAGTQFTLNITNDQIPIWFFCKVPTHCGSGMVGSINAPTSGNTTYAAFQAAAEALGANAPTVTATGPMTGGVGAEATAPPASGLASGIVPSGSSGSGTGGSSSSASSVVAITTSWIGLLLVGVMATFL
ncbi:hypothetical protein K474DRAFT_1619944 [Panus rudis PR-1116 ss-1]|nr:hypothetical protein K474DRAFT_1619944 [Panus rudis PR-1116 ss-1]